MNRFIRKLCVLEDNTSALQARQQPHRRVLVVINNHYDQRSLVVRNEQPTTSFVDAQWRPSLSAPSLALPQSAGGGNHAVH